MNCDCVGVLGSEGGLCCIPQILMLLEISLGNLLIYLTEPLLDFCFSCFSICNLFAV